MPTLEACDIHSEYSSIDVRRKKKPGQSFPHILLKLLSPFLIIVNSSEDKDF